MKEDKKIEVFEKRRKWRFSNHPTIICDLISFEKDAKNRIVCLKCRTEQIHIKPKFNVNKSYFGR